MNERVEVSGVPARVVRQVSVADLVSSRDAPASLGINIRRSSGEDGMDELVASIREEGLQHALKVFDHKGQSYVVAGNRRLEACRQIAPDFVVDVEVVEDLHDARAVAHATNVALALHPVDLYEHISESKLTADEAMRRFALDHVGYARVMRLAGLSPIIRNAWRDDEIGEEAAKAYTIVSDHVAQEKLYASLKRSKDHDSEHMVRHRAVGEQRHLGRLIAFVGLQALRESGIKIGEDLFGSDHTLASKSDETRLRGLAAAKVEKEKARLVAEGWGWAELREDLKDVYLFGQAPSKRGKYAPDVKKASGCILSIESNGELRVEEGRVRPQERRKVAAATAPKDEAPKPEAPVVSPALTLRLSQQAEEAISASLELHPSVAVRALIAAFGSHQGPLSVRTGQVADESSFAGIMAASADRTDVELVEMASIAASSAVSFASERFDLAKDENLAELIAAIPADTFNAQMLKAFDAKGFFSSIRIDAIANFVRERSAEGADRAGKMKKGDAVDLAVDLMKGWLPPQLRTVHYVDRDAKMPEKAPRAPRKADAKPKGSRGKKRAR